MESLPACFDPEALATHMREPVGKGHLPEDAITGAAGGAACGDLIRVSVALDPECPLGTILDAGFDASGCGAALAAGSAVVSLVRGAPLLDAARIGPSEVAAELGGLAVAKLHAAELACDALHRALGQAARLRARLAPGGRRTAVAMSGGVDSAVAALLVSRAGDEPVAITVELWADPANDGERSCCSASAVRRARTLAHRLGMPHFSIDLRAEFRSGVVEPYLADHAAGLTPYPCALCNGTVRIDGMLDVALRLGATRLATGHYARIARPADAERDDNPAENGRSATPAARGGAPRPPLLQAGADERKDQSYALAALSDATLSKLTFPLGEMHKDDVRALAEDAGLTVARRPDSQDLCFLAGTTKAAFLARHGSLGQAAGEIVHRDGRTLGEHGGTHLFTVGQRHGLGLGGGEPLYVLSTDARAGTVTVGSREDLRTEEIHVRDAVLHCASSEVDSVKIRYRGGRLPCTVLCPPGSGEDDLPAGSHRSLRVRTTRPVERTAAGQLACLYRGDLLVGHGTVA